MARTTSSGVAPAWSSAIRAPRASTIATLVRRDFLVSRTYKVALVLDSLFGIFNLLLFYFISHTFHSARSADFRGAPTYFAFASVGVALNLVMQVGSAQVARRVREEQLTGTLEALVAQPITTPELSLGLAGFHFTFAMARATLYIVIAGVFLGVDLSHASWLGFVVILLAASLALSGVGIALAAAVVIFRRADTLVALATLGLGLFAGAFFPLSVLPGWLRPLADVLPTRFAFDGARAALFTGGGWAADAGWLVLFGAVALPVAIALFWTTLEAAKRRGSLATY